MVMVIMDIIIMIEVISVVAANHSGWQQGWL